MSVPATFRYLPALVPFTFIVFSIIVGFFFFLYFTLTNCARSTIRYESPDYERQKLRLEHRDGVKTPPLCNSQEWKNAFLRYAQGDSFEYVYQSAWKNVFGDTIGIYLLALWRIACFCYFFGIVFLWGYIKGQGPYYFTLWNINLISSYYFLASLASIIGIVYHNAFTTNKKLASHMKQTYRETIAIAPGQPSQGSSNDTSSRPSTIKRSTFGGYIVYWSESMIAFGHMIQILYQIAGSTAFFITVVAFTSLNPHFSFWNVNNHFITSMSFIAELFLNNMTVRWEHVVFNITWALIYLVFAWIMRITNVLSGWPYFFLATNTQAVFLWYVGLFLLNILFYYIFWSFSTFKYFGIHKIEEAKGIFPSDTAEINIEIKQEAVHNPTVSGYHEQLNKDTQKSFRVSDV